MFSAVLFVNVPVPEVVHIIPVGIVFLVPRTAVVLLLEHIDRSSPAETTGALVMVNLKLELTGVQEPCTVVVKVNVTVPGLSAADGI